MAANSTLELMSSPDPLNDNIPSSAVPFTRRVTRSQAAQRYVSLSGISPRKQTFALDVGDKLSPQKLLVTVEAQESDKENNNNVSRKLFQTSTPKKFIRRKEKSTTTTIPLKGLTDDEGASRNNAATPRRRGRPPKSATPAATSKKRAGTPIQRTPRRTRRAKTDEGPTSEADIDTTEATPRPTARKSTKRRAPTPAKLANSSMTEPGTVRRGRGRPKMSVPAEVEILANEDSRADADGEDNASLAPTEVSSVAPSLPSKTPQGPNHEDEEDIWMATISEPPTPTPRRQRAPIQEARQASPARSIVPSAAEAASVSAQEDNMDGGLDDMPVGFSPSASDAESYASENPVLKLRDQDTVLRGEDFSMILIDSSSLHANMSIPQASLPDMGDETSLIVYKTLESFRQGRRENEEDDGQAVLTESQHIPSIRHESPSAQSIRMGTPVENTVRLISSNSNTPQGMSTSPRKAKTATPLGKQLAMKALQRDDRHTSPSRTAEEPFYRAGSLPARSPAIPDMEDSAQYDDSFSEIPEAVLEAATPRALRRQLGYAVTTERSDKDEQQEGEDIPTVGQQIIVGQTTVNSTGLLSDASRMLTPEETPSPSESAHPGEQYLRSASKSVVSEMRSSPPILSIAQQHGSASSDSRSRQQSSSTPVAQRPTIRLSPPPMQGVEGQQESHVSPSAGPRPALSPIVRVGRTLQSVMSDPPSPVGNRSVLGSPFRASADRSSFSPIPAAKQEIVRTPEPAVAPQTQVPSAAQDSQRSWSKVLAPLSQLKSFVSHGAQMFSPIRRSSSNNVVAPVEINDTTTAAVVQNKMRDSAWEKFATSAESPLVSEATPRPAPRADEEMDWEAELGLPSSSPASRINSTSLNRVSVEDRVEMVGKDEMQREEQTEEEDEIEDDIWAVEAQRATPRPAKPQAPQQELFNPRRRSKLPSPWTKATERADSSTSASAGSQINAADEMDQSQGEEFSMLSTQSIGHSPSPQRTAEVPKRTGKVDLSAFFSSPSEIPRVPAQMEPPRILSGLSDLSPKREHARLAHVSHAGNHSATTPAQAQKTSFTHGGLFPSQGHFAAPVPQKDFQPSPQRRRTLFAPVQASTPASPSVPSEGEREQEPESAAHSSSPSTPPQRPVLAHIPQKRNFTPMLGNPSRSLFTSSPATNPRQIAEDQMDLDEDISHDVTDDSTFVPPALKPLPEKTMSPTKSCLRSPLKPKTPGRVVGFTSSTLSPLAQAQATGQVQPSVSVSVSIATMPENTSRVGVLGFTTEGNKENQQLAIKPPVQVVVPARSAAHVAPAGRRATTSELSRTQWSRHHWVRLDELLQQRRKGSLEFQLRYGIGSNSSTTTNRDNNKSPSNKRRSAATATSSSSLLGKHVSAQGESMALERWHLDVVDAFRAEVSGWDEKVLAKRVFALLIGEERRRLGKVPRRV